MDRLWLLVLPAVLGLGCQSSDFDPSSGPSTVEQTSSTIAQVANGTQAKTTGSLNLRQGPSVSTAILDVIPGGTTITITQGTPQNGFYGVSYDGLDGFCSGKYLEIVGANPTPAPSASDSGSPSDDPSKSAWQTIGYGVNFQPLGSGANVLIAYGGYTAEDSYVKGWADALYRAKGDQLGIGHLYAVRGPNQSGYANGEIANSKLAAHLGDGRAAAATRIIIVAHSSGTFVSAELLNQLGSETGGVPANTLSKTVVFNLDGGGVPASAEIKRLSNLYFVYACDAVIGRCSENSSSMKSEGETWASLGGSIEVNASGSGCSATASGGLWCLHDTLVTTRPHNPKMYDLADDYTDFANGRKVVTSYLDHL
jgi:hypothetical protein